MTHQLNIWNQKADFAGFARQNASCFAIGNKGYVGTGDDNSSTGAKDFWEYDPFTNLWTQKADYGGGYIQRGVGFSILDKGYIGTGYINNSFYPTDDFWEYNPITDSWKQIASFGGSARVGAVGFSIGNKGYVGTGNDSVYPKTNFVQDYWEYTPDTTSASGIGESNKLLEIIYPNPLYLRNSDFRKS